MTGEQVQVGTAYRIGEQGATVQLASGAVRTLPPGRLFEFGQPGTVIDGSVMGVSAVLLKRRKRYPDKARVAGRDYQDKRR